MTTDIDWIARLRTAPSEACPSDEELHAFVGSPETVTAASFAHIVSGCLSCRQKLQEIALHPSLEEIRRYAKEPGNVPEEVLFHCMDCPACQSRVGEVLND
jgi:hypothetical protein